MQMYIKNIQETTKLFDKENIEKAKKLEKLKPNTIENIIYFNENELDNIKPGFSKVELNEIKAKVLYEKRSLLEYLPMQRHPIPYCIIRCNDKYFLSLRENGSGEVRLIGKKGLLGGHIDKKDIIYNKGNIDLQETIKTGMLRELKEEAGIEIDMIKHLRLLGLIKIEELGSVENDHLGIIYIIDLNTNKIKTMEEGVLSGEWFTSEEILNNFNTLESWSKIAFIELFKEEKNINIVSVDDSVILDNDKEY